MSTAAAHADPAALQQENALLRGENKALRDQLVWLKQLRRILRRAREMETQRSLLHPLTYETLIGLLACTGMRPGEALRLQLRDFDADQGLLLIRPCKFSPQRVIPLHPTTVQALQRYRTARQKHFPLTPAPAVIGLAVQLSDGVVIRGGSVSEIAELIRALRN